MTIHDNSIITIIIIVMVNVILIRDARNVFFNHTYVLLLLLKIDIPCFYC